jgi:tetratricopeptide (TPR) repeat protein
VNYYLAAALALDEQFDKALAAARQASEQLPQLPAIQLRPAWVLQLARRWPEAAEAYQRFLEKFATQYGSTELRETVREAKASLSNVCSYQQQHEAAEEWLEQILDEFPADVGAHNDLGYLWTDRGVHLHRSLRMTQYACLAEPANAAYRDSYGWALYRLGRYPEAVTQLRQAAEQQQPPDGLVYDHLGDAVLHVEGAAAATTIWQKALELLADDDHERRAMIQDKIRVAGEGQATSQN